MITNLKKIFVTMGLATLVAGSVLAGNYNRFISSNQQFSDTASVPSAAQCTQVAAVYGSSDSAITNGPLGYYVATYGNPVSLNNIAVGSGSYTIFLQVTGSGYSGVNISW